MSMTAEDCYTLSTYKLAKNEITLKTCNIYDHSTVHEQARISQTALKHNQYRCCTWAWDGY